MEILGKRIRNGARNYLEMEVASLYTRARIEIPVIVHKARKPGPTLLVISGIHGDEINGIEINRRLLFERSLIPETGCVIHIPIANVMAFINLERTFVDGRDLNRSFPGSKKGSLAAQVGYLLSTRILPHADFVVDLHTGAEDRHNIPQIRFDESQNQNAQLAKAFNAPFTLLQPNPPQGSMRKLLSKRGVPNVIYEGGRSRSIDEDVVEVGTEGVLNVAAMLGIIKKKRTFSSGRSIALAESHWVRANSSGMFQPLASNGAFVEKGELLGYINGPYAQYQKKILTRKAGYIICMNEIPVVHLGDALFHIGETQNGETQG
ncbi:MAG: succinylglutamate desuccinylase/aspartoacylase family protein [Pyrinomonadaceae bacterium]